MTYITCTKSQNTGFPIYKKTASGEWEKERTITIKGNANVISNKTLVTPRGAITTISDEDLEILTKNASFNRMVENGYIVIHKDKKMHVEDLKERDDSAQLTKKYFADKGMNVPVSSKSADIDYEEEEDAMGDVDLEESKKIRRKVGRKSKKSKK